ncbi:amidohydrolase [Nocardioides bruguierae]|uniref:amidohydrolase n=1 Tax=Nocardioides bruguierae TaxID=2945102 RepID=UPI00201FC346|nr:amidohydrolase [Nocardioides bruguierae]MCL8027121.1 amidohydrolase [Nocardioides bruguierae]
MTSTLFTGGGVFDGHRYRGAADVLVVDGRVAVVAAPGEVGAAPDVAVVDADGALLLPGFTDAHVHAVQGGLERIRCDLSEASTAAAYQRVVGDYALAHPEAAWVQGGGWAMSAFPGGTPTADLLDAVVPDRPVFLPNRDHHGAWVNSRALALAGIDEHTPDPADGRIERDAQGRPTGTLHEGAMHLVSRLLPPTHASEHDAALAEAQRYLHSVGVTGWQDAIVGAYAGMDDPGPAYVRAARAGTLTADVVGALWWDRERGLEQLPDLLALRAAYTTGRFRATSVKVMQDGVAENGTAAMLEPYLDRCGHPTSASGHSFVDPHVLRTAVPVLAAAGFQVHVHAIGDRGVREALDAFESLDEAGRSLRHHLAHLQVVHPDDVPRFAELGLTANMQTLWACLDEQMAELTIPFLGPERSAWQYPFGDLHRAGAALAAGSDWPVSTPDPLAALHVAVNRVERGADGPAGHEPFLPEQALPLEVALAAYTSGSAGLNGRHDAGRLAPGAVADLVLLDRDVCAGPVEEVGAAGVVGTWVAGEQVHGAT